MRLFHRDLIKAALIKFGVALVSIEENIGCIDVGSVPSVVLALYKLLRNSAISLYASSGFSSLA